MRENRTSGSEGGEPGNRHSPTPIGRSERLLATHARGRPCYGRSERLLATSPINTGWQPVPRTQARSALAACATLVTLRR